MWASDNFKEKMKTARANVFSSELQRAKGKLGAAARVKAFKDFYVTNLETNEKKGPFKTVKHAAESFNVTKDKMAHHLGGHMVVNIYQKAGV
jgi:hypothetical protein